MPEHGLDQHEWETQWQQLEPLMADDPADALPEIDGLIQQMIDERVPGHDDSEIERQLTAARDVAAIVERGEQPDPGDVGAAIDGYRAIYESLVSSRRAP